MEQLQKKPSYVKNLYNLASKTAVDRFIRAKKSLTFKGSKIPNDTLGDPLNEVEATIRLCEAFKQDVSGLKRILKAVESQEGNAVNLATTATAVASFYCSRSFLKQIEKYSSDYITIASNARGRYELLRTIEESLDTKLKDAVQVKKGLEARYALYTSVTEEEKKLEKCTKNGDSKEGLKREKLEQAIKQYEEATEKCRGIMNKFIEDKNFFFESILQRLMEERSLLSNSVKEVHENARGLASVDSQDNNDSPPQSPYRYTSSYPQDLNDDSTPFYVQCVPHDKAL